MPRLLQREGQNISFSAGPDHTQCFIAQARRLLPCAPALAALATSSRSGVIHQRCKLSVKQPWKRNHDCSTSEYE